jgi:four helix bundle protein
MPSHETYSLIKQMQRSAVSIPSNCAEGCSRESEKEFKHFVEISSGSAYELETQLIIANNLFDLNRFSLYQETYDLLLKVQAELNALRNRLKGD